MFLKEELCYLATTSKEISKIHSNAYKNTEDLLSIQGTLTEGGFSTIYLLIMVACFVKNVISGLKAADLNNYVQGQQY